MEGTPATVGEVDLANALDLSESEDEEEMEDLIEDFAANNAPMDEVYLPFFPSSSSVAACNN